MIGAALLETATSAEEQRLRRALYLSSFVHACIEPVRGLPPRDASKL
jgi:hypothetical protein